MLQLSDRNLANPLLAVDWQERTEDGTRLWEWFLVIPGGDPRFHELGLVREITVEQAYSKAVAILRPKTCWISRRGNRVLEIKGQPAMLTLPVGRNWNVYDLRSGSARMVGVDLPSWELAKMVAEDWIGTQDTGR